MEVTSRVSFLLLIKSAAESIRHYLKPVYDESLPLDQAMDRLMAAQLQLGLSWFTETVGMNMGQCVGTAADLIGGAEIALLRQAISHLPGDDEQVHALAEKLVPRAYNAVMTRDEREAESLDELRKDINGAMCDGDIRTATRLFDEWKHRQEERERADDLGYGSVLIEALCKEVDTEDMRL